MINITHIIQFLGCFSVEFMNFNTFSNVIKHKLAQIIKLFKEQNKIAKKLKHRKNKIKKILKFKSKMLSKFC